MEWIYAISYFVSLTGLMAWFYYRGTRHSPAASKVFLLAYLVYIICLAWAPGTLTYKLMVLGRDLAVMAAVIIGFQYIRHKAWMMIAGLLVYALVVPIAFPVWVQTFPSEHYMVPFTGTSDNDEEDDDEGEFLIRFHLGLSPLSIVSFNEDYRVEWSRPFRMESPDITGLDEWWLLNILPSSEKDMDEILGRLQQKEAIAYLEWNDSIELEPIRADLSGETAYVSGFNDPLSSRQWYLLMTGAYEAVRWLDSMGLQPQGNARIAILDTGIDGDHEDIKAHYRSIQAGYDHDPHGHGTHCAGLAAAVSNNGLGIASAVPSADWVSVSSVRVLNNMGGGTQRGIIQGILEAADAGADVISLSLGGRSRDAAQRAYEKAVNYAHQKGAIVVVAAGNEGIDARRIAPANVQGVIAVAAVNRTGSKAVFSNSVEFLDRGIAAPGVEMVSTLPGNRYVAFNGTSMATPMVANTVAILRALDPLLDTETAYNILRYSGTSHVDAVTTGPVINLHAALKFWYELRMEDEL